MQNTTHATSTCAIGPIVGHCHAIGTFHCEERQHRSQTIFRVTSSNDSIEASARQAGRHHHQLQAQFIISMVAHVEPLDEHENPWRD
jgi:hypothetical protein